MLNGHKTQSIHNHINKAGELWGNALNLDPSEAKGLIDNCTRSRDGSYQQNGIMLRRDDPELDSKLSQCFEWGSYLAKDNTKGNTPDRVRAFGGSSVSKRNNSKK